MNDGEPNDTKNSPLFGFPLSAISDACLTLIYPQTCRLCENSVEARADGIACRACWQKTRIFKGAEILCEKCGALPQESNNSGGGGEKLQTFCRRCSDDEFDAARAVGLYEHALLAAILNLKKTPFIPLKLENLFFEAFLESPFADTNRIIPVPLSKRRLSERGFNQASLLAKVLAGRTNLPFDENSLIRRIHTPQHRAGMDRKARAESVRNAFEVTRANFIENENILLIDDVFTSGATASNCAKALKNKGARAVYVLTVARAF